MKVSFAIHSLPVSQPGFSLVKAVSRGPEEEYAGGRVCILTLVAQTESLGLISCLIWAEEFTQTLNVLKLVNFQVNNMLFRKTIYSATRIVSAAW